MVRGLRVVFSPSPHDRASRPSAPRAGAHGTVTAARTPDGLRTYRDGPRGGLVYVQWDADGVHIVNSHGEYPEAVRQVAHEDSVALIDLHKMSAPFYEAMGKEKAPLAFGPGDATHHSAYGAYELAKCVVQGIRDAKLGAPVIARAMAIVHTCMYDAWAAYDDPAVGTQLRGALRRPADERTGAKKQRAVSFAAYRALIDVLPVDTNSVYIPLMRRLGYDPEDTSTDIETPSGIGNVACGAVLEFRHHDKSNQLGDLAQGPYSDWTGYKAVNNPGSVPAVAPPADPNRWQALIYINSTGDMMTQTIFAAPMVGLYLLSIGIAWIVGPKHVKL